MMRIIVIARLTIREVTRRKIALTAVILGILFLIFYNIGYSQIISNNPYYATQRQLLSRSIDNVLVTTGLYAVNFLTIAMAALIAADSLAGEISSGTIQCLATKPIRRGGIVFGKWLGFAIVLAIYVILLAGGVILTTWIQTGYSPHHIPAGIGLIYLGSLVMMSITLAFSSTLSTLATGGAVFGLYGLVFIASWVEQIGSYTNSQTAVQLGIIASFLLPSEALWRRAAYEISSPLFQMTAIGPFTSRSIPSAAMIIYAVIYLFVALGAALWNFNKRDL